MTVCHVETMAKERTKCQIGRHSSACTLKPKAYLSSEEDTNGKFASVSRCLAEELGKAVESCVLHGGIEQGSAEHLRLNFSGGMRYFQGIAQFDEKHKHWSVVLPPPKDADFKEPTELVTTLPRKCFRMATKKVPQR